MPRRDDLHKILLIGSGPIIIGQACEFDYSGTQACKALREEGYEVVLVNSNPATIMTDPDMADRTYIEPLTWETIAKVIEIERPDALLPTLGGQTGLNLAVALADAGVFRPLARRPLALAALLRLGAAHVRRIRYGLGSVDELEVRALRASLHWVERKAMSIVNAPPRKAPAAETASIL